MAGDRRGADRVGLALIGGGRIGEFRSRIARLHPQVDWIGVAEIRPDRAKQIGTAVDLDLVTEDYLELLDRPEVTAAVVCTDEHLHEGPLQAVIDRGLPVLIEKPLALNVEASARLLDGLEQGGIDAVMGYTQRYRQRFMTAKDRIGRGALGEPTLVTARGFLNRMVSTDMYESTDLGSGLTPMTMAGTHMVDLVMWFLAGRTLTRVQATSKDRVYGPRYGGQDLTACILEFDDGTVCNIVFCWTLPTSWPGAVYSLDLAVVGTNGVLTIDDTHRDIVMAVSDPQLEGYVPRADRRVDFLGSYLPGDMALGHLRGPMHEETISWLNRLSLGQPTHHASAAEGHERLLVTKIIDLAARTGQAVTYPPSAEVLAQLDNRS
jgi:predicted dehydrogenase